MFELFRDGLKKLIERVLEPITERLLRLPWIAQCAVVLAIVVVFGFAAYREPVSKWSTISKRFVWVVLADGGVPPIMRSQRDELSRSIANMVHVLHTGLDQAGKFADQAWTSAHIITAVEGRAGIDPKRAVEYFTSEMDSECFCWQKYRTPLYPRHIGVTATVLVALARLGQRATQEQVRFLLENQKKEGWWPVYPSDESEKNASTYATALTSWALYEQLTVTRVPDVDGKVQTAIARGVKWLYANRIRGTARWKDYPDGREMLSLSGLVLHVLHRTKLYRLSDVDRLWLKSLPGTIPFRERI